MPNYQARYKIPTKGSGMLPQERAGSLMALTPKQARFVAEYLIDLNATQAAKRAGYSERTAEQQGHQLLKKSLVAAAIADAQSKRSERTDITQDYVLNSIFTTMERCKQAEAVTDRQGAPVLVETPDGEMARAYTFNAMGVFKGAELLGKHLGMFSGDSQQVTINLPFDGWELKRAEPNAPDGN